jgi:hypothetical protein
VVPCCFGYHSDLSLVSGRFTRNPDYERVAFFAARIGSWPVRAVIAAGSREQLRATARGSGDLQK